jgi:hypothetical protein
MRLSTVIFAAFILLGKSQCLILGIQVYDSSTVADGWGANITACRAHLKKGGRISPLIILKNDKTGKATKKS